MRRLQTCVERWPECNTGEYDPRCCRFPKSCSCTVYPSTWTDTDLEPRPDTAAHVEVGQTWQRSEGRQRLRIVRVFRAGRGLFPSEPGLEGQMVVTCVPRNGGRDVVLTLAELHDHFTLIEHRA